MFLFLKLIIKLMMMMAFCFIYIFGVNGAPPPPHTTTHLHTHHHTHHHTPFILRGSFLDHLRLRYIEEGFSNKQRKEAVNNRFQSVMRSRKIDFASN